MTLIIKELVVKSTIIDKKPSQTEEAYSQKLLKEEIIKACASKVIRHLKNKNKR